MKFKELKKLFREKRQKIHFTFYKIDDINEVKRLSQAKSFLLGF